MYVVFVPIAEWVLSGFGDSLTIKTWFASLVSLYGLYLLSGCAEQEVCFGGAIQVRLDCICPTSCDIFLPRLPLLSSLCWVGYQMRCRPDELILIKIYCF